MRQGRADRAVFMTNPLLHAQVSVRSERLEEADDAVPAEAFQHDALPYEAALLAGTCFLPAPGAGPSRTGLQLEVFA